MSEEEQTCGKGLAQNAAVPAKLSELTGALAGVLEAHIKALDLIDENSRIENEAYNRLARQQREIAAQLDATAREMAGYRDLPMGRHYIQPLASPEPLAAFERYVGVKRGLLALLHITLSQDEEMLTAMRAGGTA
jgi:hypothetical protein